MNSNLRRVPIHVASFWAFCHWSQHHAIVYHIITLLQHYFIRLWSEFFFLFRPFRAIVAAWWVRWVFLIWFMTTLTIRSAFIFFKLEQRCEHHIFLLSWIFEWFLIFKHSVKCASFLLCHFDRFIQLSCFRHSQDKIFVYFVFVARHKGPRCAWAVNTLHLLVNRRSEGALSKLFFNSLLVSLSALIFSFFFRYFSLRVQCAPYFFFLQTLRILSVFWYFRLECAFLSDRILQ